jgi:hypothetical protein
MSIRKFLKEVGVTSQREIEEHVRTGKARGRILHLRMTLTSDDGTLTTSPTARSNCPDFRQVPELAGDFSGMQNCMAGMRLRVLAFRAGSAHIAVISRAFSSHCARRVFPSGGLAGNGASIQTGRIF